MHWLTNKQDNTLCITLTGPETRSGNWSTFSIGGIDTAYTLNVGGFSGSDIGKRIVGFYKRTHTYYHI